MRHRNDTSVTVILPPGYFDELEAYAFLHNFDTPDDAAAYLVHQALATLDTDTRAAMTEARKIRRAYRDRDENKMLDTVKRHVEHLHRPTSVERDPKAWENTP